MSKETPNLPRILTMVVFTLSCFGILLFLWLSFGGSVPLKPESYRFKAAFPEATTLAQEADVRIAGVNVGKVKRKLLQKGTARTLVEVELQSRYAPIPEDSRAILRQKTLLGETYVELSPGSPTARKLPEDAVLSRNNVEPTVEIDEILRIFDPATKRAFREWVKGTAGAIEGGTGEDLNDALGNLPGFATDGADVLSVLDEHREALRRLVRNTGVVFGALSAERGQLRGLIQNSKRTFSATAEAQESLAETISIFPTFLDESRLTADRLRVFSNATRPLVTSPERSSQTLQPAARRLGPTFRDIGLLAPDLEQFFRDLNPLIAESGRTLPAGARFLRGARRPLGALHTWLQEFNPILSWANFDQAMLASFINVGGPGLHFKPGSQTTGKGPLKGKPEGSPAGLSALAQFGLNNQRTLQMYPTRQHWDVSNAYQEPNAYTRSYPLGSIEAWDCGPIGGERREPAEGRIPCFNEPDSLWDRNKFPRITRGKAPIRPAPKGMQGTRPVPLR
jgi:virulence factor Mce-like protein